MFAIEENYRYFLKLFLQYIGSFSDVFAYALLPNHFHFFIRIRELESGCLSIPNWSKYNLKREGYDRLLVQQFSNLFNAYTKAYNRQQDRKGKLFMEPFNRRLVETPANYTQLVRYVHASPLRHGLCQRVGDWRFSSYHHFFQKAAGFIQREEVIRWFGTLKAFCAFYQQSEVGQPRA
jgi:putative transposase